MITITMLVSFWSERRSMLPALPTMLLGDAFIASLFVALS